MLLERVAATIRLASGLPALVRFRPDGQLTVADRLERQAERLGERTFVLQGDQRISYAGLNAQANRVAHWAREQGVRRGDIVALLMENRPEYLATWLGLSKLGAVSALINTNLAGRALDHALGVSGARQLVVGGECLEALASASRETLAGLTSWISPDPDAPGGGDGPAPPGARSLAEALARAPDHAPPASWRAELRTGDDLFYIYTSGTTGNPKAARFSHLRFFQVGDAFAWAAGTRPDDVEYLALPLYHTAGGVVAVGRALGAGAAIALRRRFSASQFWDDVRRYGATSFQYIGELCRYLLAQPPAKGDRDHAVRIAVGNGLRPDIWAKFQRRFGIPRILEFYGATEGNAALVNLEGKVGAVGRYPFQAISNVRIIRYDVEGDRHPRDARGFCIECRPGEPGELLGRLPSNPKSPAGRFEGYTSKEDTERKILRDVFKLGDAWFRTGDLLQRDDAGYYYFVDRIGDTFRWKGENVSTQEVAEILAGFPGIDMISIYGVEVPGAEGRAGMAAFVLEPGAAFDGAAFHAFSERALPGYAAPVFVRVMKEAPVTGTLKLRKVDLQREGFDAEAVSDPLYLRDDRARSYVRLTPDLLAEIRDGRRRL
jgi:fatty-acyl-CoA synthase